MARAFIDDPALDVVADSMLGELSAYLPAADPTLPEPNLSVASMSERAVGIGRTRGAAARGTVASIGLKGIRIDALVRFQLWAADPVAADQAIGALNGSLIADRERLRSVGFLRFSLETASLAESISDPIGAWRKHADYRVLYEFDYETTNSDGGLIARIPVAINSGLNQSMVVTDDMTRWDNVAAPALVVRGTASVGILSLLAFTPGPPPNAPVTLTRTYDGAIGSPATYATLPKFVAAVSGVNPMERHAKFTFPSFNNFKSAFASSGAPIVLGDFDKDGTPDQYQPLELRFSRVIQLPKTSDRFEVTYGGAKFNRTGVVYLRVRS
jgi:hypothetical protein